MPALMKTFKTISRCAAAYYEQELRGTGLGACQMQYVIEIHLNPGISQDALAGKLYVDKSRVSRSLAQLEACGYITRRPSDADRRMTCVYPTGKLAAVLPRVKALTSAWNALITADLSPQEQTLFSDMLDQIEARAREWADHGKTD